MNKLQIFADSKSGYRISYITEGECLILYLLHLETKQAFTLELKDPIEVMREDFSTKISPKKIPDIISKYFEQITISQAGEITIKIQMLKDQVLVKLPAPRPDQVRDMISETRFKVIEQELEKKDEVISSLFERIELLQFWLKKKENKEMRELSKIKRKEQSLPLSSKFGPAHTDEKIQTILSSNTQECQHHEENIKRLIQQHLTKLPFLQRVTFERQTEEIQRRFDSTLKEMHNNHLQTSNKIENLEREIDTLKQWSINSKEVEELVRQLEQQWQHEKQLKCQDQTDVFRQDAPDDLVCTETAPNGVKVINKINKTDRGYNYFFSKLALRQQRISFKFRILSESNPLLGICSRKALQQKQIYRHNSAFFYTFGDSSYYIMGVGEMEQDVSQDEMQQSNEVTMNVDLINWQITWRHGNKPQFFTIPEEVRSCDFHLAILMKAKEECAVELSHGAFV